MTTRIKVFVFPSKINFQYHWLDFSQMIQQSAITAWHFLSMIVSSLFN